MVYAAIASLADRSSMAVIEENDFNQNIIRCVSNAKVDLREVHLRLAAIAEQIKKARTEHNGYLRELGLREV